MSDVSCKVAYGLLAFSEKRGLNSEEFFARMATVDSNDESLRPEFISNPKNRIPWNSFVTFTEVFETFDLGPDWEDEYFTESITVQPSWIPYLRLFMGWISSPLQAYRVVNRLVGPASFGSVIHPSLSLLPDGRILVELKIDPRLKDSRFFFNMSKIGLAKLPLTLGLPPSLVEVEIRPWHAQYMITPPPSRTLWARLSRSLGMIFGFQTVFDELSRQDRQFRQNYDRLLRSETELRMIRRQLESKFNNRTRELELANAQLQEQIRDIIKKEEENRSLHEKLAHLQKLEAVGTLAGGISHEINNVLHGIFLSVELAERTIGDGHPAKDKILTAKKFASRGQGVMKQILAFSRKAKIQWKPIGLIPTVEEAVAMMRSTLPRNIEIHEHYLPADRSVAVMGDPTQLQQVIINLCSNAAHAMRARSGELYVSIEAIQNTQPEQVAIRVRDTGEGVPIDIRDRLFDPFFTTKPAGEGTGMGLSVVHGIVQSHGGSIRFESTLGQGTEFMIILPTVENVAEEAIEDLDPQAMGGQENILVVDDEAELANLLADTLEAFGYSAIATTSPAEALHRIRDTREKIDLVLTDYSMPGMTGLELAYQARTFRPKLPIILCTGFSTLHSSTPSESTGISTVLTKPLDAIQLNKAIRTILQNPK